MKNSLWNRLLRKNKSLNVIVSGTDINNLIPLEQIKNLMHTFSDLTISINRYKKHQNENIPYAQCVILIESKDQPTEFGHLQLYRTIMIQILKNLKDRKLILPKQLK